MSAAAQWPSLGSLDFLPDHLISLDPPNLGGGGVGGVAEQTMHSYIPTSSAETQHSGRGRGGVLGEKPGNRGASLPVGGASPGPGSSTFYSARGSHQHWTPVTTLTHSAPMAFLPVCWHGG